MARRYSKGAQKAVKKEMHKFKRGKAHSGPAHKTVKSRKQAIAIALSEAREKGAKVPSKGSSKSTSKKTSSSKRKSPTSRKSASSRRSTTKKAASTRSTSRRSASRKSASKKR